MTVRDNIFELFIKNKRLRFSEIEKSLKMKSNTLAYHLDLLVKEGMLRKEHDDYLLTQHGDSMIPFFAHIKGQEKGVLPVVLAAIVKDKKILMLKRTKRPYQGYWVMPGGKLKLEESIADCALRESKEETGLDCEFSHIAAIVHERVKEDGNYKHAFLLFLTVLKPKSKDITESEEGKLEWFPLDDLQPGRIVPSDYHMIKDHLNSIANITCVIMEEKEEKLVKFTKS